MTLKIPKLEAQFNRAYISENDFFEAISYIEALIAEHSLTIQRAIMTSAIVAYARPFTNNGSGNNKQAIASLAINLNSILSTEELKLHTELLLLRNQAIAHSEFDWKPIGSKMRQPNGFVTQSKRFDVLSQPIDINLFKIICEKMAHYCGMKLFEINLQICNETP